MVTAYIVAQAPCNLSQANRCICSYPRLLIVGSFRKTLEQITINRAVGKLADDRQNSLYRLLPYNRRKICETANLLNH